MFRFCIFLNPLFNTILLGMMYKNRSPEIFILYVLLGSGLSSFWTTVCFSSTSDITREKMMGTLPAIFVAPVGFDKIVIGKILGNSLWGILTFILNVIYAILLFGITLKFQSFSMFITTFFLMILSMISISIFLCGAFTLSRIAQLLMNFIEYPIMIVTGMVFSIDILPSFVRVISYVFSPTWIMIGFELSINGGTAREYTSVTLILILLTFINFIIAFISLKKIEKACRVNASLEVF